MLKEEIVSFLKSLANFTKTFICIGNHDQMHLIKKGFNCKASFNENRKWFDVLNKINNLFLLDNKVKKVDKINFVGITPSYSYYEKEYQKDSILLNEIKSKMPLLDGDYNILLMHSPINIIKDKIINETEVDKVNLILSGHMHNGLVPPILDNLFKTDRGIISPDGRWFLKTKLTRGRIDLPNKTLIINGAITKIHDCSSALFTPFNALYPMSLDVIVLKSYKK